MLRTGRTFPLTLCPVLQAAGGAAGDDAEERDGQWALPVSALRGGAGVPGQLLRILQRLQEESLHQVRDRGFPRPEAAPVAV